MPSYRNCFYILIISVSFLMYGVRTIYSAPFYPMSLYPMPTYPIVPIAKFTRTTI